MEEERSLPIKAWLLYGVRLWYVVAIALLVGILAMGVFNILVDANTHEAFEGRLIVAGNQTAIIEQGPDDISIVEAMQLRRANEQLLLNLVWARRPEVRVFYRYQEVLYPDSSLNRRREEFSRNLTIRIHYGWMTVMYFHEDEDLARSIVNSYLEIAREIALETIYDNFDLFFIDERGISVTEPTIVLSRAIFGMDLEEPRSMVMDLAIGALGGLILGLVVVLFVFIFDFRIKTRNQLERIFPTAMIPYDRSDPNKLAANCMMGGGRFVVALYSLGNCCADWGTSMASSIALVGKPVLLVKCQDDTPSYADVGTSITKEEGYDTASLGATDLNKLMVDSEALSRFGEGYHAIILEVSDYNSTVAMVASKLSDRRIVAFDKSKVKARQLVSLSNSMVDKGDGTRDMVVDVGTTRLY